jgi:hypothetical protein
MGKKIREIEVRSFEDANPNPEYLIKSIAEQGYSLETALADLIDNSITANANKIEVIVDMETMPFRLFLADNGNGMNEVELKDNMNFPSNSPEQKRKNFDLGRFGLGMKTASFSQTRKFTVLSRKKGAKKYSGRTWDVDFLKQNGWKIIVNTPEEVELLIRNYSKLSHEYYNSFEEFEPNTIVIWDGLYKFENYLAEKNRNDALKKEINEVTTDYFALVFHRFMERKENPLQIRINNIKVNPFNPFPEEQKDFRQIQPRQSQFNSDVIKIKGFVLPSRSIEESTSGLSVWTTRFRGLMDMEGIYIYRADRIILFGGWNGLIKKAPRLQLARLRVEVGNSVDHLLHLNVAKSQVVIPHELRSAFENYIDELKIEAEREFFNRGIRKFSGNRSQKNLQLFERISSNKGTLLQVNHKFPLLNEFEGSLNNKQRSQLKIILRMINNSVNRLRQVHEDNDFVGVEEKDGISIEEITENISGLLKNGLSKEFIKDEILPHFGFKIQSLPRAVQNLIN